MHPVTWGVLMVNKLQHIANTKISVRSVGSYLQTTLMPAKSGHGRNSIRVGEQDTWAYLSYIGGKDLLEEMFIINGDNQTIKSKILRQIEENGSADFSNEDIEMYKSGSSAALKVFSTIAGLKL
jgi:DNA-directed RNA polymerase beta subunit